MKSTVERGRNSWGDSPRDNGARKTSAPVAIVPARGQWGVPIFPKLPRVDIAIESRPNCNWILHQTATRFPAKKKGRRACNLSIPISTDNRGLSLSSMTRPFLYLRDRGRMEYRKKNFSKLTHDIVHARDVTRDERLILSKNINPCSPMTLRSNHSIRCGNSIIYLFVYLIKREIIYRRMIRFFLSQIRYVRY